MSDQRDELRNVIADFFETNASTVGADFVLGGQRLASSIARAGLDAAIRRRVGVKLTAVYSAKTYGELESALTGESVETNGSAASNGLQVISISAMSAGVHCGVDIEQVANLPKADDYWEHEFYQTHFAKAEIAYCLTTEKPREHFAARWAAKEALKKCDAGFMDVDPGAIQVAIKDHGAPKLELLSGDQATPLPHALSLSHTNDIAIAVVVSGGRTNEIEKPAIIEPMNPSPAKSVPTENKHFGWVSVLAVAALIASMIALWRTL